jgi:hypothetical protein
MPRAIPFLVSRCGINNSVHFVLITLSAVLVGGVLQHTTSAQTSRAAVQVQKETRLAAAAQLEEIYIARSVAESSSAPTAFCAEERIGFASAIVELQYTFRSTVTQASDGRMTEMNAKTIGNLHACFGASSDLTVLNFYGEGLFGHVPFKGIGDCHLRKADFPESGLIVRNCFLDFSGLPSQYVGGLLTTNTLTSKAPLGMETDPRGYIQTSIATIRLWRKRAKP